MTRDVECRTMKRTMKGEPKNNARPAAVALAVALATFACTAPAPLDYDAFDDEFEECPESPNCVSSLANDERHRIEPISLASDDPEVWLSVVRRIRDDSKATIIIQSDYYLMAEYRSTVFAFVDDLELLLRDDRTTVDVRSASRLGYWDWGVNRARVEKLRESLQKDGLAR
jgi:uncharacterized protein (DUF1499 family)